MTSLPGDPMPTQDQLTPPPAESAAPPETKPDSAPAEKPSPDKADAKPQAATPAPQASAESKPDGGGEREDWEKEVDEAMSDESVRAMGMMYADQPPAATGEAGDIIRAKVEAVQGDDVFVNTGGKHQGVVALSELKEAPQPGDTLELVVDRFDNDSGLLVLSRSGAVKAASWATLAVGVTVEGRVTGMNKGGLELDLKGIRGFMPASQVALERVHDISEFIGERFTCKVMEINKKDKSVLISRRKFLEAERESKKDETLNELAAGQVRQGIVRRLAPFGAFVDIGGVDGLLHISDMSWTHVDNAADIVKEGQKVDVKILKYDPEKKRISLGIKQLAPNPWDTADDKYAVGATVTGTVTRLADFGAFVELEPGIEGLIPISEMTWGRRIKHPSDIIQAGQVVQASVLKVEPKKKRLSMSLKQMEGDPWTGAAADFPQNSIVKGKVARLTDFGAFVELRPGVDGLVHVSEISEKRVRVPGDVLKEGQEVEARVLNVDEGQRRISLTIKNKDASDAPAELPPDEARPKKKRKKPLRGGLSSHFDW